MTSGSLVVLRRLAAAGLLALPAAALRAQGLIPVSRAAAVDSAVVRGTRLAVARADTAVAFAQLLTARALPNPTLNLTYAKSVPEYHVIFDVPIELPGVRGLRVQAARAGRTAAQLRFAFERAAAALDADTTYTRALASLELARLSRRNARDADSLRKIAAARRAVGDASDLDVELATVTAGQAANVASTDSLTFLASVLDLQAVMGLAARGVVIVPSDSLTAPPAPDVVFAERELSFPESGAVLGLPTSGSVVLQVAAAQAALQAAQLSTRLQRRNLWATPSLTGGVEWGDPSQPGYLPTVGVVLPLPLFDRNRGPIAQARAEQERARAELALAQVQSRTAIARSLRELAIALGKVERDRALIAAANRVASMSLTAYREGASALPNVLTAQRDARDVLAQYVNDLASAWIASAQLRVLSLTTSSTPPR